MSSFAQHMDNYRKQIQIGTIQKAYRGLMDYIMSLKAHLKNKYPAYDVSSGLYFGYMDMTYFSIFPEALKRQKLKIAIVFLHEAFRFEVWLSGVNKNVQEKYWKLFKESGWSKYKLVSSLKGADSIVEHVLVDNPGFSDLDALTRQIEAGTLEFISNIESFLSKTEK